MVGLGVGGVLALAAVVAVAVVLLVGGGDQGGGGDVFPDGGTVRQPQASDLWRAAETAGCELKTTKARGEADRLHTDRADVEVDYCGNPPTLGRHWPPGFEADDGLYQRAPADEALVHTMEHGRVIFWAKPTRGVRPLPALGGSDPYLPPGPAFTFLRV